MAEIDDGTGTYIQYSTNTGFELEQIQSPDVTDIDDTTEDGEPVCKKQKLEDVTQDEIRIVLVGKTAVGKSELANSLLGRSAFDAAAHMSSVTSSCSSQQEYIESIESTLKLIDTPGLFHKKNEESTINQSQCIKLSKPGPHVFIIVLSLTSKFTAADQAAIDCIEDIFGKKSREFMFVVVTNKHSDVKIDEEWVKHTRQEPLKRLLEKCKNRYCSIDNKGEKREKQKDVKTIIELIKQTIKDNNNEFYTGDMYGDSATLYMKYLKEKKEREKTEEELEQLKKDNKQMPKEINFAKLEREKSKHHSGTRGRVRGSMKEPDRRTLNKNIPKLLRIITEPDRILQSLCSRDVFDREDREKVQRETREKSNRAGVTELLNLLLNCGSDALQLFGDCLKENNYNEALELLGFKSN